MKIAPELRKLGALRREPCRQPPRVDGEPRDCVNGYCFCRVVGMDREPVQ